MAKFCINCGNELPENAAMCVKCGTMVNGSGNNKGNKKKGLPTWAIVLIVVSCVIILPILVLVVIGIIGINYAEKNDVDIKDYVDNLVTARGTIGDTLTDESLSLTLTEAYKYDSIGEGYFVNTPAEGKEYLVLFFDIENISTESEYVSYYDFEGYVDDVACDITGILGDIEGISDLATDLAPSKKAQGFVAFEVNKNWENFEIHYKEFLGDKTLVFKVSNIEGA